MEPTTKKGRGFSERSTTARSGVFLSVILCATQLASSQQPTPVARAAAAETTQNEQAQPAKPSSEGVKVHGHWVIDVRNPDGTLAQHRDFENSLTSPNGGDAIITGLLTGTYVYGTWYVVESATQTGKQICSSSIASGCAIMTATHNPIITSFCESGNWVCKTGALTAQLIAATSSTASTVQLQGSITASATGNVASVATWMEYCTPDTGAAMTPASPVQCTSVTASNPVPAGTGEGERPLTATTLPTPITIVAGQVVTFTVTISFS